MAGKGGYQRPANPAMYSNPGAGSQRTDGSVASKQAQRYIAGMPNYGDGQDLQQLQAMAPMAATPDVKAMTPTQVAQSGETTPAMPTLTPLNAPSARPNEPVTHGALTGPGGGPEVLGLVSPDITNYQTAKDYLQSLASNPMASPATKYLGQFISRVY